MSAPAARVPRVQPALVVGVAASARRPAQVERRAAHAAHVAYAAGAVPRRSAPGARERPRRRRSRSRPAPRPAPCAAARRPRARPVSRRRRAPPRRSLPRQGSWTTPATVPCDILGGHADAPLGQAEEEVDGPVERVDHPANAGRLGLAQCCLASLLPQQPVARTRRRQQVADRALGGEVGRAHQVGRRRLGLHVVRRPPESRQQQRARELRRLPREREQGNRRGRAHARLFRPADDDPPTAPAPRAAPRPTAASPRPRAA